MITVKPLRDEALRAGFVAMAARLPADYSFETFREKLLDWKVDAFHDGNRAVGMLMTKGAELHVAVVPEVRGKWLSRRIIREVFAPILAVHGQAKTKVAEGNVVGLDFVRRIRAGFADLTFDPGTILSMGSNILGSVLSADSASDAAGAAAGAQTAASMEGIAETRRQFEAVRALLKPYVEAGTSALSGQEDLLGLNGPAGQQTAITGIEKSPLFGSLVKQGENALLQNASATGGLRGGNLQTSLAKFRPELLSKLIEQQFSKLGGLTSIGQNAAAGVGNAGMSTGANISRLLGEVGSAGAGAALAGGQANANLFSSIGRVPSIFAGFGANSVSPAQFIQNIEMQGF